MNAHPHIHLVGHGAYVPKPCDCGDIGDLEFSEIGRGKHSIGFIVVLAGFLLVASAVAFAVRG